MGVIDLANHKLMQLLNYFHTQIRIFPSCIRVQLTQHKLNLPTDPQERKITGHKKFQRRLEHLFLFLYVTIHEYSDSNEETGHI